MDYGLLGTSLGGGGMYQVDPMWDQNMYFNKQQGWISDPTAFTPGSIQAAFVPGQGVVDQQGTGLDLFGEGGLLGGGLMDLLGFGLNAFNMFKGWSYQDEMLDIAKDYLGISKEQWQTTKDEMERIRNVRNNLTNAYGGTLVGSGLHPEGSPVPGAANPYGTTQQTAQQGGSGNAAYGGAAQRRQPNTLLGMA